jgi:REP element-mobilizing transposase RayT
MARKLRIQYPGAIYHVLSRGDRRENIFTDEQDRRQFLGALGEASEKTGWQVHAYCLMANHFHLVIETPQANLVAGMKWFLGTYTSRFNRRHKVSGHLFSGRYKALPVDGSGTGYFRTVCDYVHLNPARAKLLAPEQRLLDYPWSSYPEYLKPDGQRLPWLRRDRLLGELRINPKQATWGKELIQHLETRRREEAEPEPWKAIRRGWCFGGEKFKTSLLEQVEESQGGHHYGAELREGDEAKAERLVREGLAVLGWKEKDLGQRAKTDPEKVGLARRLRKETTMTMKWITERLQAGSVNTLRNSLGNSRD